MSEKNKKGSGIELDKFHYGYSAFDALIKKDNDIFNESISTFITMKSKEIIKKLHEQATAKKVATKVEDKKEDCEKTEDEDTYEKYLKTRAKKKKDLAKMKKEA